jgi:hypothetical protein
MGYSTPHSVRDLMKAARLFVYTRLSHSLPTSGHCIVKADTGCHSRDRLVLYDGESTRPIVPFGRARHLRPSACQREGRAKCNRGVNDNYKMSLVSEHSRLHRD